MLAEVVPKSITSAQKAAQKAGCTNALQNERGITNGVVLLLLFLLLGMWKSHC